VVLARKSPVVMLTMSSSAVPHPRIPPVMARHTAT
jgi:hypothetical protein